MKNFLIKYKTYIIGIIIGAVAGFLYWKFVGCSTGGCMITSKWYNSTLYGMLMGFLIGSSFTKGIKNESKKL